tara:strand:- start:103 stop:495 length:393 start_codon:yes stop_codon:yes gene_type:complete
MNELPYLPYEIVKMIYDYIRPKKGFEFKVGQIFKCEYNIREQHNMKPLFGWGKQNIRDYISICNVEITEVRKRPYYNEIFISGKGLGHKLAEDEEGYFATTIKMNNPYKDMIIDKTNFLKMEINKTMLIK